MPATSEVQIRARVQDFMNDYAEWARKFARPDFSCDVDWEGAKAEFERLRLMHLVPGCSQHVVGMNLGCPPDHDPVTEHILSVKMESDQKAVVETDREGNYPMSFEYSLQLVGTEWRIGKVHEFFGAEGQKVTDADLELLKMWPTEAVPFAPVPDGLARLFDGPARLQTSRGIANTQVRPAGSIEAPSGFFVCDDPSEWGDGAPLLEMPVPPGKHPVELVYDDVLKIIGAARVVFARNKSRSFWAKATRRFPSPELGGENSHIIAVDVAMVGLVDAGALLALGKRERERLYWKIVDREHSGKGAVFVPVTAEVEAVAIDSGCGDGGYAAFWELDSAGKPISLVFDFADLATAFWKIIRVPFNFSNFSTAFDNSELEKIRASVLFHEQNGQLTFGVYCARPHKAKLFDASGEVLFDSEGAGYSMCEGETTCNVPAESWQDWKGLLELQVYLGHRYQFVET